MIDKVHDTFLSWFWVVAVNFSSSSLLLLDQHSYSLLSLQLLLPFVFVGRLPLSCYLLLLLIAPPGRSSSASSPSKKSLKAFLSPWRCLDIAKFPVCLLGWEDWPLTSKERVTAKMGMSDLGQTTVFDLTLSQWLFSWIVVRGETGFSYSNSFQNEKSTATSVYQKG